MLRVHQKNGFASIVEVIITAIIFTIAAFGIFSTITSVSPMNTNSEKRLQAAYRAQNVVEGLRGSLAANTWNSSLAPGAYTVGDVMYNVMYTIADVPGINGLKKVTLNVTIP